MLSSSHYMSICITYQAVISGWGTLSSGGSSPSRLQKVRYIIGLKLIGDYI